MNEEAKAIAEERLKRELSKALTRRECAWFELRRGADPDWIAMKYRYPVETMRAAKVKIEAERAARQKQTVRA